jgi:DNA polymerase III sliding clamp (beta) subunit (PCNA family)
MATSIKVMRKDLIGKLASIKDDNVSIADITIERRKLLEALKLQTQSDADILTLTYGKVSWLDDGSKGSDNLNPTPCIQFSCNHTIMRFMNHPKQPRYRQELKVIPINFVDHTEYIKSELSGIPLDTQELIRALTFVQHGIETDGLREVLACVLFESGDDTLKLVTADGFRLPIAKFAAKGIPQDKVLIHFKDIIKLLTFLKSNTTGKGKHKVWLDTYVLYDYDKIKFTSEKGIIEFNKQVGDFPNYGQLIPKDGTKIEFIASDMLEGVKAVSIMAKDGSGIIRLQFQKYDATGKIILTARSEEIGDSSVDCDAIVESDCKIAVNANYLVELLSQCGDARITLRVTTPSNPMVFDISDSKQETVMPMFVQWEGESQINEVYRNRGAENIDTEESPEPTPEELNETIEVR